MWVNDGDMEVAVQIRGWLESQRAALLEAEYVAGETGGLSDADIAQWTGAETVPIGPLAGPVMTNNRARLVTTNHPGWVNQSGVPQTVYGIAVLSSGEDILLGVSNLWPTGLTLADGQGLVVPLLFEISTLA